jgi:hypothetical protein
MRKKGKKKLAADLFFWLPEYQVGALAMRVEMEPSL